MFFDVFSLLLIPEYVPAIIAAVVRDGGVVERLGDLMVEASDDVPGALLSFRVSYTDEDAQTLELTEATDMQRNLDALYVDLNVKDYMTLITKDCCCDTAWGLGSITGDHPDGAPAAPPTPEPVAKTVHDLIMEDDT